MPVTLELDSDLRPRRRVRVQPAGRAAHGRDGRDSRSRSRSFPAAASDAVIYEDDGETMAYTRGGSVQRQVTIDTADRARQTVDIGPPSGTYRPAPRSLMISIPWEGEPARVLLGNGQALTRRAADALDSEASGWTIDSRMGRHQTGRHLRTHPNRHRAVIPPAVRRQEKGCEPSVARSPFERTFSGSLTRGS